MQAQELIQLATDLQNARRPRSVLWFKVPPALGMSVQREAEFQRLCTDKNYLEAARSVARELFPERLLVMIDGYETSQASIGGQREEEPALGAAHKELAQAVMVVTLGTLVRDLDKPTTGRVRTRPSKRKLDTNIPAAKSGSSIKTIRTRQRPKKNGK